MPFNSHTAALGGKKSKRSKDTNVSAIRNLYAEFLDNNTDKLQSLFDKVAEQDAAKALDLLLKLSAYVIAKPTIVDERAETDLSNVPEWLRPNAISSLADDEFKKQLNRAKKVIEASEW